MIEPDTIKLLRECDAGIKMGVNVSKFRILKFFVLGHLRIEIRFDGKVAEIINPLPEHIATMCSIRSHFGHDEI